MSPETVLSERTLSVRYEGLALFRSWAEAILRAEQRGEEVPVPGDLDAMVEWLDGHGLIEEPVDRAQARVLIELVHAGGAHTFKEEAPGDESGATDG